MGTKQITKASAFFSVKREKLYRKDRTDTGYDALYRNDDGTQLSVVSRDYRLVRHREAIDFVHHMLDDLGIEHRKVRSDLGRNGGKLFYEIQLPEYRFNAAADGIKNTALDGSARTDELVPRLIVKNSYDRSSSFQIIYGGFRLVCQNGMLIGEKIHEIKILHRGEEIDYEELREPFIENITATIDGLKQVYRKLNQEDGHRYFEAMLLEETIAQKYKQMMIEQMAGYERVEYDKDDEGKMRPVGSRMRKAFTGYLLWNIVTSIATHRIQSAQARYRMQRVIAEKFAG